MGRKELLIGKEKDVRRMNETKDRREEKEKSWESEREELERTRMEEGEDGIASAAVSGSDWSWEGGGREEKKRRRRKKVGILSPWHFQLAEVNESLQPEVSQCHS